MRRVAGNFLMASSCLQMKVLLWLFLGIHFTIGLTLAVLSQA